VPAGILIAGAATVDFSAAVPMMTLLTVATIALFIILRTNESLEPAEAASLLALYSGFLVLVALETAGLVRFMT
jgi:cation:H+ antiporter